MFVATESMDPAWRAMTQKAVLSVLAETRLKPVCVFFGAPSAGLWQWLVALFNSCIDSIKRLFFGSVSPVSTGAPLAAWLEAAGVEVVYHARPAWAGRVRDALATAAGRANVRYEGAVLQS